MMMETDVLIIGGGAAGLMCAGAASKRGRRVIVIEHTDKIAEKIRISGGGRCNFTNINCTPDKFISNNPHFCTSALSRFTQHDFINLVGRHDIAFHEKKLGQLFCDNSAHDIIAMLLAECDNDFVDIKTSVSIDEITKNDNETFTAKTSRGEIITKSVVIACGGLSIPKIGASPFGYEIAKQFGLSIVPPRAGLVPLTFDPDILSATKDLSGVAVDEAKISSESGKFFEEALLFTHKGISGPAVLQISSYWNTGEFVTINLAANTNTYQFLKAQKVAQPKSMVQTVLSDLLPKRLAQFIADQQNITGRMADLPDKVLEKIAQNVENWSIKPSGSEGYRTAEVTLGGVNTDHISSKTFECKNVSGLYFIGEVLDVTGHLGGYNFQWAWSSGWCAGQYV